MGKSFREGRSNGTSHWSSDGYGYDQDRQGNKGFSVRNRQDSKKTKKQSRAAVYEEHERVVNY